MFIQSQCALSLLRVDIYLFPFVRTCARLDESCSVCMYPGGPLRLHVRGKEEILQSVVVVVGVVGVVVVVGRRRRRRRGRRRGRRRRGRRRRSCASSSPLCVLRRLAFGVAVVIAVVVVAVVVVSRRSAVARARKWQPTGTCCCEHPGTNLCGRVRASTE